MNPEALHYGDVWSAAILDSLGVIDTVVKPCPLMEGVQQEWSVQILHETFSPQTLQLFCRVIRKSTLPLVGSCATWMPMMSRLR